ncbi:MAG: hypothetical protein KBT36_09130 [Kurthia sp.]|nr:hypothetical protein [Candidatus Kurthia equi]
MRTISKLLLLIVVSIFFFFIPLQSASAEEFITGYTLSNFECGEPVVNKELDDALDDYIENDANMAEKFLTKQSQNLFHIGDINGISTLIFGNPYCVWADLDDGKTSMSTNGVFTDEEMKKIVEPMTQLLGSVFVIVITIAMLIHGLKIMANSVKGRAWASFWNDFGFMVLAIFLGFFYFEFINVFFQLNAAFVMSIRDLISKLSGNALSGFSVMSSLKDFINVGSVGSFLIVIVAEWILSAILNIIYIARKVVILILMVMGVVALYSLLFAKTRAFFQTWLKELFGNIFLQSIHAVVFFGVIQFVEMGAGVFFKIVLMMMFIPVSGMISKWLNFGDSSSALGNSLTMVGLGGTMTTMMLASQASNIIRGGGVNGGSAFNTINGGIGGGGGGLTQLANSVANDTSATSIAMRAQGTTDSTIFNGIKNVGEKLGTFVGGSAGVIAGPAGAALGARLGQSIGGGIPQMARNMAVGASSLKDTVMSMKNYEGANGATGFKALFGGNATKSFEDLNSRRQMMANAGESLGVMLGGQRGANLGRSMGAALSGASRPRLNELNSASVASAFNLGEQNGAVSFAQLSQKYPNAEAKWVQTNQGSSFHVNTGDGFKQVGVTGAADGLLKDGQARVMDFKLSDPGLNYAVQPNGTYKPDKDLFAADMKDRKSTEIVPSINGSIANNSIPSSIGSANGEGMPTSISFANQADAELFGMPSSGTSTPLSSTTGATIPLSNAGAASSIESGVHTSATPNVESPISTISSSQSIVPEASSAPTPAAVGLQGSTPEVMRTSDAYIVNNVNHTDANEVASASTNSTTSKVQDAHFQSKNINPDAYIFQGVQGSQVSSSDRIAENVHSAGVVSSHWAEKARQGRTKRQSKVV